MRTRCKKRLMCAVLLARLLPASGQNTVAGRPVVSGESIQAGAALLAALALREIDDPCTGARWLLMQDPGHPEGPGRLVLSANSTASEEARPASAHAQRFVIHSEDALLVEEHTAVVDAQLEATALGPAVRGAEFRARLRMGGKVVRVFATAPGRAAFAMTSGAQR